MEIITMKNPSTGLGLGEIQETTTQDIKNILNNSKNAFNIWSENPIKKRIEYLKKLRRYLSINGEKIAQEISKDTGKPIFEAYSTEILPVIDIIKYYEKNAFKYLKVRKVPTPIFLFGKNSYIMYKPIGAIAIISPWNFPFHLTMIPAITALVCGNTVVIKPSEITAYTGTVIEDVFKKVGFPREVVQIVHGGKEAGKSLIEAKPDMIFFTGSVTTGKQIMKEASNNLIPVILELGGKDPMIVFNDANLERAVNGALWGGFTNCGQVCMSVERVYVHEKIYDRFIELLLEKVKDIRQGCNADIGCMTSSFQVQIVKEHIKDAVDKGAKILYGGSFEKNIFVSPTVVVDVDHGMKVMNQETFGPILPIMKFKTEQEAINFANDSVYGLNASVWSDDLKKARRVASKIQSGSICINDVIISISNPNLPFGGVKNSGIGRYHGKEGLYAFCQATSIVEDRGKKKSEINWYPYTDNKVKVLEKLVKIMYSK